MFMFGSKSAQIMPSFNIVNDEEFEVVEPDKSGDYEIINIPTGIESFHPKLVLHIPTKGEIGAKIMSMMIIDLPLFVLKNFYLYPSHSTLILYLLCPSSLSYLLSYKLK